MSQKETSDHVLHELDNASFDTSPLFRSRCDGAMFTRRRAWKGLVRPSTDDGADNVTGSLFLPGTPCCQAAKLARPGTRLMPWSGWLLFERSWTTQRQQSESRKHGWKAVPFEGGAGQDAERTSRSHGERGQFTGMPNSKQGVRNGGTFPRELIVCSAVGTLLQDFQSTPVPHPNAWPSCAMSHVQCGARWKL